MNQMYSEFDEISHRRDVFKVETIGDAYVAVGGAPIANPQHAERILLAGFDYIEAVRRIREVSTGKDILIRSV